jgi:hypothetical protein
VQFCNPSTWEAEAEVLPVGSQPGLPREALSQKQATAKCVA